MIMQITSGLILQLLLLLLASVQLVDVRCSEADEGVKNPQGDNQLESEQVETKYAGVNNYQGLQGRQTTSSVVAAQREARLNVLRKRLRRLRQLIQARKNASAEHLGRAPTSAEVVVAQIEARLNVLREHLRRLIELIQASKNATAEAAQKWPLGDSGNESSVPTGQTSRAPTSAADVAAKREARLNVLRERLRRLRQLLQASNNATANAAQKRPTGVSRNESSVPTGQMGRDKWQAFREWAQHLQAAEAAEDAVEREDEIYEALYEDDDEDEDDVEEMLRREYLRRRFAALYHPQTTLVGRRQRPNAGASVLEPDYRF